MSGERAGRPIVSGKPSGRSGLATGGLAVVWVIGSGAVVSGAAGLALVGLGLGLILVMALTLWAPLEAVEVERLLPDRPVRAGARVNVTLRVRSRRWWPWLILQVEDEGAVVAAGGPAGGAGRERRFFLLPGRTAQAAYSLPQVSRGVYRFNVIRVSAVDPLGLVRRRLTLTLPGELEVWPVPAPLEEVRESLPTTGLLMVAREAGEPRGVRPFEPGDSPRLIHWPATAKTGRILVRQLEAARPAPLHVVIDPPSGRSERFEPALSQAAGAVDWGMRHRCPVSLSTPSGHVAAGLGLAHYRRLMRLLAECLVSDSPTDAPLIQGALLVRVTGEGQV